MTGGRITPFAAIGYRAPEVSQLSDQIEQTLDTIVSREILDGHLITGVSVSPTGVTQVAHGLGRRVSGWVVVKKDADANVWDQESLNTLPEKYLRLTSDANANISLWVF